MKEAIIAFFKEEDGLTAVEYAIMHGFMEHCGAGVFGGKAILQGGLDKRMFLFEVFSNHGCSLDLSKTDSRLGARIKRHSV